MTLSIYAVEAGPVAAVKAIRDALRALDLGNDTQPTLTDAQEILDAFNAGGAAALARGAFPVELVDDLILSLEGSGVFATYGNPARAKSLYEARRLTAAGASPEQVFNELAPGEAPESPLKNSEGPPEGSIQFRPDAAAATALALTVALEGNPLAACATARILARAQGPSSEPLWRDVQQNIILTYPWIRETLAKDKALL